VHKVLWVVYWDSSVSIVTSLRADWLTDRTIRAQFLALQKFYLLFFHGNVVSLLLFVINNKNHFQVNFEIHNINSRNSSDFYQPLSHVTIYQKCPLHMGIKVYNSLPAETKYLSHNIQQFKSSLRRFLQQCSFYKLQEYINCKATVWYVLFTKLVFIILSLVWNFDIFFHIILH